jgi:DNA-binding NarL/FixJ family response regulator
MRVQRGGFNVVKILIVDDDPFIRESLNMIFELHDDIEVAGTCMNGEEAFQFLQKDRTIEVVLMDIRMPVCDGVEGSRRIKEQFPDIAILILTTFDDDDYIIEALKHGANGYMLKNIPPDRIIDGIKSVAQGNLLIHPDIAKKLTGFLNPKLEPLSDLLLFEPYKLSPTEQIIVQKIAGGLSNKEIAQELFLGEGTVKNYISEILSKLSLRDRTQIAIFYLTGKTKA